MRKLSSSLFFIFSLFLFFVIDVKAIAQSVPHKLLIIISYHPLQKWNLGVTEGYAPYIFNNDYELSFVFLEEKKFPLTEERQIKICDEINTVYANTHFSAVLAIDNPALGFVNDHYNQLKPIYGLPVFAGGINHFELQLVSNLPQALVIPELINPIATFDKILEFFPDVQQIYILNDYTISGKALKNDIQNAIRQNERRFAQIKFLYSPDKPFPEVISEINKLPKRSVLLIGVYNQDYNATHYSWERMSSEYAKLSLPIFCLIETSIDTNVIGGKLDCSTVQGTLLGKTVSEYFKTGKMGSGYVHIKEDNTKWIFSYPALQKYKLHKEITDDATLLFAPENLLQKYKKQVNIALFITALFLITIIVNALNNLIFRKKVKKNTANLQKEIDEFNCFIHSAFVVYIKVTGDLIIDQWNKTAERIFGYTADKVIGKNIFDVIVKKEDIDRAKYLIGEVLTHQVSCYYSEFTISKYGDKVLGEWYITTICDEKTNTAVHYCIMVDVTEKKRLAYDLEYFVQKYKELKVNYDRMLITSFDSLKQLNSHPDLTFNEIKESSERFAWMLKNRLVERNLSGSLIKVNPSYVQVNNLMTNLVELLELQFEYKNIQILNQLNAEQTVYADMEMVSTAFLNILSNACKFSNIKGIILMTDKILDQDFYEITIQDNGMGLPTETLFEYLNKNIYYSKEGPFGETGTGLGLQIAKEFILQIQLRYREAGGDC
ncbi:MAG: PAS domain-containing sensor histidine kinase, partial [Bacteroidales bacterium]